MSTLDKTKEEVPDLIWFLPALFALGALISGGAAVYALASPEIRAEAGITLLSPIGTLVVIMIRGIGYWYFFKQRARSISWLIAALVATIVISAVESVSMGVGKYFELHGTIGVVVGYAFSIGVIIYAFELRKRQILK